MIFRRGRELGMANLRLSPSANLLRTSRLFALPPALPRTKAVQESPTSTGPYPTHATIETTPSSLARGDWGLKRSLPRDPRSRRRKGDKTYGTSTPMVRIGDIDSIDNVTDFESAADYAINLRKYQDLHLPLSRRTHYGYQMTGQLGVPQQSVFDPAVDNTRDDNLTEAQGRWKFRGPTLSAQTQGEFDEYLKGTVRNQKGAFLDFLRERWQHIKRSRNLGNGHDIHKNQSFNTDSLSASEAETSTTPSSVGQSGKSSSRGEGLSDQSQKDASSGNGSDAEFEQYLKELRQDDGHLLALVQYFFDIPNNTAIDPSLRLEQLQQPSATHGSAGLSYLKTSAHMSNHPTQGPRRDPRPIQARILKPAVRDNEKAILGIGGFIAEDARRGMFKSDEIKAVRTLDMDEPGGAKVWVHLRKNYMSPNGRMIIEPERATDSTLRAQGIEPPKTLGDALKAAEAEARDAERRAQAGRNFDEAEEENLGGLGPGNAQSDGADDSTTTAQPAQNSDASLDFLELISTNPRR